MPNASAWYSLAGSPIGLRAPVPPRTVRAAAAIGFALIVVDLVGTRLGWWRDLIVLRLVPPAIAAVLLVALGARADSFGLRWPPLPSVRFWLRGTAANRRLHLRLGVRPQRLDRTATRPAHGGERVRRVRPGPRLAAARLTVRA
jgi:hypothetical protein